VKRRLMAALAVPAAAMLTLSACGGGGGESEPQGTAEGGISLVREGELTVCTHLSYQPFQFERDGEIVGFDVDLVDLVAEELGVQQEIVNTPFETITTGAAFNTGECDLAAAGMTITPERAEVIEFSEGYFDANQAILARADSDISDEASLAGKTVAAQTGTTGLQYAEENLGDAEVFTYEDLPLSLQALQNGDVESVINDNGVLYDFAKENPDFEVKFDIETGEEYGMAAKKGNTALIDKVNEVIGAAKEDGRYDEIYQEWFGTAPE
jgi:polar amino acid transport system substrate-binding protein